MSSPSLIRSDRFEPAWRLEPRTKIRCRTPSRLDGEIGSKNREFGKNRSTPSGLVGPYRIFHNILKILTEFLLVLGLRLKRTRRNVTEAQSPLDGFLPWNT